MKILTDLTIIISSCIAIYYFCMWMYKKKPAALVTSMPYCKYDDDYVSLNTEISKATTNSQLIQLTKKLIQFQNDYDAKNDVSVQMDVSRLINMLENKEQSFNTMHQQFEGKKIMVAGGIWLCIILSLNVNAQYAGFTVINKGIGVTAGILANKVNIQAALTFPIIDLNNANTYSLTAGYQINITNDEKDNYSFTPSIGAALVKSRTWDAKLDMTTHDNIKPIYGVELGKDAYMGRVFLQANYIDKVMYYGLGMKVFFNR